MPNAPRAIDGIVLLDKPGGMTSNRALQRVKRRLGAAKAGHTGSLDPLATGLLPICLGQATKLASMLLASDKRYTVTARLGVRTDSADSDGEIVDTATVPTRWRERLEQTLSRFTGSLQQTPPMYSALKYRGRRLYELARAGETVPRPPREVSVFDLQCVGCGDDWLSLAVHCSKGTYVRSLVEDIAAALGTLGHVVALRRDALGPFGLDEAVPLSVFESNGPGSAAAAQAAVLTPQVLLRGWPQIDLSGQEAEGFRQGQRLAQVTTDATGLVCVLGPGGSFLGVGEVQADGLQPKRVFLQESLEVGQVCD